MPQVVGNANGTCRDRLGGDEWIHAADLLTSLFQVTPDHKGLSRCRFIESKHTCAAQKRLKPQILRSGRARPCKANPNFYGG